MLHLQNVLFSAEHQLQLVTVFQNSLKKITASSLENLDILFGFDICTQSIPTKRKKESNKNAISAVLCVDSESLAVTQPINTTQCVTTYIDSITTYLNWIITSPTRDPFQITWCVLSLLYISDDLKLLVSKYTHPDVAVNYFTTFNTRFETYLCGQLKHIKKEKISVLIKQAKTPFEIILQEWLTAKKVLMTVSN